MSIVEPEISIIIPVLNEAQTINATIRALRSQSADLQGTVEVIVVDGDPAGRTCSAIEDQDVIRLLSKPGRAKQMNKGAASASGEILLFLHADTVLEPGSLQKLGLAMENPQYAAGAFDLRIAAPGVPFRIIERVSSYRSRLTRIPYGDQGIFIRSNIFQAIGGYPEIPLMEDVALMRQLKTGHYSTVFLSSKAITSARRWQEEGVVFTTMRNWVLITLYLLGVSPAKLARFYRNII